MTGRVANAKKFGITPLFVKYPMMSLREQLAALDADVSNVWMVDLMVRSMSQFSYYMCHQLQTLMLLSGTESLSTPQEAKAIILILDKNAVVEKELHARQSLKSLDITVNPMPW
ncbi:Polyketide cyclase/dehydrase [Phytophthora palmivora]|uniref:Polyketide cyclase/dehydrase n=1 Tax=Phytophthora palmivora TaxID=4796 RepID=A0A2P4Y9F2_9STRA|nr:Polyketide cyclase/dehydrase [Phytophthora palmivora]